MVIELFNTRPRITGMSCVNHLLVLLQGSEWQLTSMAGPMQSFQSCFLEGMVASNKAHMNSQVQVAIAASTLAW